MFIITSVKDLAIWLTEKPFDKHSGVWHMYDTREEYEDDLYTFQKNYGTKLQLTLKRVQEMYKHRGESQEEE